MQIERRGTRVKEKQEHLANMVRMVARLCRKSCSAISFVWFKRPLPGEIAEAMCYDWTQLTGDVKWRH